MDNRNSVPTGTAISERAAKIGVPLSRLAAEAGIAPSTPYRWANGAQTRTLIAMQRALETRERDLLIDLMELHPDLVADRSAA
jgi:transposase-like protein